MFEAFELKTDDELDSYQATLSTFNLKNPYYLLDYIDIFSEGLKNLVCFSYLNQDNNSRIMMLVHLKPITIDGEETVYYDVITPYGYSGPISTRNVLEDDFREFWKKVDNWYAENSVVSEFVRFSLSNDHLNYSGEVVQTMLNIKGKIVDEDLQWTAVDRKVRKNVNKALRENLKSVVYFENIEDDVICEFFNIYIETMVRTSAKRKFHYKLDDFRRFIARNDQYCSIGTIYLGDTPIASELVLLSADSIYSFLGGTLEKYFDKRPNDFLKLTLIDWARKKNLKYFVLGGGYGSEDGIFRYKKSFFPNDVVHYYTGRKIINKYVYDSLLEKAGQLRISSELDENVNHFPRYR